MIFSNKIYRISSGDISHLYSIDANNMELYLFNEQSSKNNIVANHDIIRCFDLQNKYDCHFVSRINDELICKFTDENATIIKEPL